MQRSLIFDLLGHLSTKEQRRFKEFVHSPYHNKNKKVRALCDLLSPFHPKSATYKLTKNEVFSHIYPDEKLYQELKINNILSDLLQLAYAFLAQETFQQKALLQKKYLLINLSKKDADRHIEKNLRSYRQLQEKAPHRSYDFFLDNYYQLEEEDHYQLQRAMRINEGHFQKQNDALDLFYQINKLRMACEMTSRNLVAQAGYQSHHLEDILRWIAEAKTDIKKEPALNLYYRVLLLLRDRKEETFQEVRVILKDQYQLIPKQELWPIYSFALNFCIIQINSGDSTYYREILQLYQELLDRKIIIFNGSFTQWSFKNIVTTGIRLQEFDWTEKFIRNYQDYLLPEAKENAIVYNLAALCHARRDFTQALQLLHNVEFTDTSYHLGAKTIQLKSFYELEETEPLFALIEAFRKYLLRNRQISDYRKKATNNMLKLVRKIYQLYINQRLLNSSNFNRRYKSLDQQLKTIQPIANKDWLEEVFGKLVEKKGVPK